MKTKLTLSVDEELLQFARHQAKNDGKSVSSVFSEFLLNRKAQAEHQSVPKISEMVGSLNAYKIDGTKAALRKSYARKYTN